jgi:drug/metabolite transporter (DMT)-like permease
MGSFWTLNRAAGTGLIAGLGAVILWPIFAAYQEPFRFPYMAALSLTAFCGLSVILMTAADFILRPKRGQRTIPIRTLNLVLGLLLFLPASATLGTLID